MRQGGASTRASRSAFPRRPGAFHWSSAELKIPGSFFGVPTPGFAVEILLNYDLWRESTEVAGEKDQGNMDGEFLAGGCGGDAACEDHRGARQTAHWLRRAASRHVRSTLASTSIRRTGRGARSMGTTA